MALAHYESNVSGMELKPDDGQSMQRSSSLMSVSSEGLAHSAVRRLSYPPEKLKVRITQDNQEDDEMS